MTIVIGCDHAGYDLKNILVEMLRREGHTVQDLTPALDPKDDEFQFAWGRTQSHLELLRQAVNRDGAQLVVVAIPAPFQLDRRSLEFHASLGYEVRESWLIAQQSTDLQEDQLQRASPPRTALALEDWARHEQVPYLDLTDRLADWIRSQGQPLYFVEDVHWNPAGNAAAAAAIPVRAPPRTSVT
jgi:hypothetical protein